MRGNLKKSQINSMACPEKGILRSQNGNVGRNENEKLLIIIIRATLLCFTFIVTSAITRRETMQRRPIE